MHIFLTSNEEVANAVAAKRGKKECRLTICAEGFNTTKTPINPKNTQNQIWKLGRSSKNKYPPTLVNNALVKERALESANGKCCKATIQAQLPKTLTIPLRLCHLKIEVFVNVANLEENKTITKPKLIELFKNKICIAGK